MADTIDKGGIRRTQTTSESPADPHVAWRAERDRIFENPPIGPDGDPDFRSAYALENQMFETPAKTLEGIICQLRTLHENIERSTPTDAEVASLLDMANMLERLKEESPHAQA